MAIASSNALVEVLRDNKLVEPNRLDQLVRTLPPRLLGADELARDLVSLRLLTDYQAEQVLKGHAQELFLGPYVILDEVGDGAVGQVFKAKHQKRGHMVAVKVIRKKLRGDATILQRFRREVTAVAGLSHPNLVRPCDVEEIGTAHFYAMEFIDGISLEDVVNDKGPLPIGPVCDYMRQAAHALQYVHERGLIHRDIKPANIMISRPTNPSSPDRAGHWGTAKVLDLGFALLQQPDSGSDGQPVLTKAGYSLGTVDYMAPEQIARAHEVDIRADIYALGCVIYHLLTGQPPFPDGEMFDKLAKHRSAEPEAVEKLRPEVPEVLASIVRKMMAKKREDRYQTPGELAEDLKKTLDGLAEPELAFDWHALAPAKEDAPRRRRITQMDEQQAPAQQEQEAAPESWQPVGVAIAVFAVSFFLIWLLFLR